MKFSAVVLGGTGLVGSYLIKELINNVNCTEVRFITRRKVALTHPKIIECIIDFNNPKDYTTYIKGDVLFSCLGTTLSQAGSKEKQYLVDYTYQYNAAKAAKENGIAHYVLVSSPFAKISSGNYYRKMKAELERDTKSLNFNKTIFIKPNGLIGERKIKRKGEKTGVLIFKVLAKIFPKLNKYQPILGKNVAKAMLSIYLQYQSTDNSFIEVSRNKLLQYIS